MLAVAAVSGCGPPGLRAFERAELTLRLDPSLAVLRRFERLGLLRSEDDLYGFVGLFAPTCLHGCVGFRAFPVDHGGGYRVARWVPRLSAGTLLLDRRLRHGLGDLPRALASFARLERLELRARRFRRYPHRALIRARYYAAGLDHLGYRRVDSGLVDLDLVERTGQGWRIASFSPVRVLTARRREAAYALSATPRRRRSSTGNGNAAQVAPGRAPSTPRVLFERQGQLGLLRAEGSAVSWQPVQGGAPQRLLTLTRGAPRVFVVADLDGDGRSDLFVGASDSGSALFFQRSSGRLRRWSGPTLAGLVVDAAAADFDGDGWVDLYVVRHGPPDADPFRQEGLANLLLRGRAGGPRGDGLAAARRLGLADRGWGRAVCAGDLDGDGRVDLVLANEHAPVRILLACGAGFRQLAFAPVVANTCALGDADGDGRLDIYLGGRVASAGFLFGQRELGSPLGSAPIASGTGLWLSRGAPARRWRRSASLRDAAGWDGWVGLIDHDADGDLDLWRRRHEPNADFERRWWWRVLGPGLARRRAPPGLATAGAWLHWAAEELWINDGRGNLAAGGYLARMQQRERGAGVGADADGDGRLDLLRAGGSPRAWRGGSGELGEQGSVSGVLLRLRGRSPGNRDAVGAQVVVWSAGRRQLRVVGLATGWPGAPPGWLHLGVGRALRLEHVEIRWPDGQRERHDDLPVRRRIMLTQGEPVRWQALGTTSPPPAALATASRPAALPEVGRAASQPTDPFDALLAAFVVRRGGAVRSSRRVLPSRAVLVVAPSGLPASLCRSLSASRPALPLHSVGPGGPCGVRLVPRQGWAPSPLLRALLPAVLLVQAGRVTQSWATDVPASTLLPQLRRELLR